MKLEEAIGSREGLDSVVLRPNSPLELSLREKKRLFFFSTASLLFHLGLFGMLYFTELSPKALESKTRTGLKPSAIKTKVLTLDQLQSMMPDSRSVVQSARVKDSPLIAPDRKKVFLGEQTQRVAKQTRSAQFGNRDGGSVLEHKMPPEKSRDTRRKTLSKKQQNDGVPSARARRFSRDQINLSRLGVGAWVLPEAILSSSGASRGASLLQKSPSVLKGTHDLLDRDIALGAETLLNTDEYKFASLFNRIKSEVAPRWEPKIAAQLSDPRLSVRSGFYRTETTFVVDASGNVIDVIVNKASGVDGFDQAARGVLMTLPPIKNIPKDLVDKDGRYRIQLGFVVNVAMAQLQAEYVPDPRLLKKRESSR